MSELSAAQGFGSVEELFQQHTRPLLLSYGDSYTVWGNHSPERQIFDTLLLEAGRCLLLSVTCGLCAHVFLGVFVLLGAKMSREELWATFLPGYKVVLPGLHLFVRSVC